MKRNGFIALLICSIFFIGCEKQSVLKYVNKNFDSEKKILSYIKEHNDKSLVCSHLYFPTYSDMDYALLLKINEKRDDRENVTFTILEIYDENKNLLLKDKDVVIPSLGKPSKHKDFYQSIYRYEINSKELDKDSLFNNDSFLVKYVIDNRVYIEYLEKQDHKYSIKSLLGN